MKKEIIHKPRDKTIIFLILGLFLISGIFTTSLGYSLFNSEHLISGEAHVRVDTDIRVTNIEVLSMNDNAYPTYKPEYSKERSSMFTTIKMSGESIIYQITIENKSDKKYELIGIEEELNTNPNITYEIIGLNIYDTFEPNTTKTFTIKQTSNNNNQVGDLILKYEFVEYEIITLASQILIDNPNRETRTDFNTKYTTSNNGNTIHYANGQDNKITYYFAGQVSNNYVKFGKNGSGQDLYWRIVRINEDNSVRLIYAGLSPTDTAGFISTSQGFNPTNTASYYVGYEYNGTQHGIGTNSSIKGVVDTWYTSNLADEGSYLSKTAIYCNDRTVPNGYIWSPTWSGQTIYHSASKRLQGNYSASVFAGTLITPSFVCSNNADKFTVSNKTGNGALEYPIALITADEISYAGGLFLSGNTSYYIYQNATSKDWYTMSPSHYDGGAAIHVVGGPTNLGRLHPVYVYDSLGVRPVTSLKSCVEWKHGTKGTASNPYEVLIDNTCANLEN